MKLNNICTNCQELVFVDMNGSHTEVVFSYGTPVLAWRGNQYHRLWEGYSATTIKHINKATGMDMTKKRWETMPVENSAEFIS